MMGHHSTNCHFLAKLQQALAYLKMEPAAPYKKRNNFKGKNSYQKNTSYGQSLQDAGFIPYDGADADNFLGVVENNHNVFTPDIINTLNTNTEEME